MSSEVELIDGPLRGQSVFVPDEAQYYAVRSPKGGTHYYLRSRGNPSFFFWDISIYGVQPVLQNGDTLY